MRLKTVGLNEKFKRSFTRMLKIRDPTLDKLLWVPLRKLDLKNVCWSVSKGVGENMYKKPADLLILPWFLVRLTGLIDDQNSGEPVDKWLNSVDRERWRQCEYTSFKLFVQSDRSRCNSPFQTCTVHWSVQMPNLTLSLIKAQTHRLRRGMARFTGKKGLMLILE